MALLGFGDDLTLGAIVESGIDSAVTAGLSSAVYGSDFGSGFLNSFSSSIVTLATADFQTLIGDQGLKEGGFAHAGLHGLVGCISAAATGADCASGALGGVVQSVYAGTLEGSALTEEQMLTNVALIGGLAGYFASGGKGENVSATSGIARSGLQNNFLFHVELERKTSLEDALAECLAEGGCDAERIRSLAEEIDSLDKLSLSRDVEMLKYCQVVAMVRCVLAMSNSGMADAYNEYADFLANGGEITPEILEEMDRLQDVKYAAMNGSAELTIGMYRIQMGLGAGVGIGFAAGATVSTATAVLRCAAMPGCLAGLGREVGDQAIIELSAGGAGATITVVGGKLVYEAGGDILKVFDDAGRWLSRVEDVTGQGRKIFVAPDGALHLLDDAGELVSLPSKVPNRTFDFIETQSGTHLRRTVDVDGQSIQINSGHGYNRPHSGGNVQDSGLSMHQIDNAIANDIARNVDASTLPRVPAMTSNTINIDGYSLTYDVTKLPNGNISVSTYYPGP